MGSTTAATPSTLPTRAGRRTRWAPFAAVVAAALAACGGGDGDAAESPAFTVSDAGARPDTAIDGPPLQFSEIAAEAGLDFVHETGAAGDKWMPETMGSGGGFLDYDGDGWPDLFLVNGATWQRRESSATSRLYRNLGDGTFTDVTAAVGLDFIAYGMGATFADYDADGDVDIYVTALGDNMLFRNDGGRFTDVAGGAGVSSTGGPRGHATAWSTSASWLDADRDGWLDLFVCNYVQWTPETDLFTTLDGTNKSYATPQQYEGESCRLYRGIDGTRFDDVTEAAGVFNPEGKSLGVAVTDFNDDAWPDIVVANDTYRNFLYINDGDGTFTDAALSAGVALDEFGRARAGMGIDVADLTGSGAWSVVVGNFSREPLSLFTQIGAGDLFQDRAGRARLTRPTLLPLTFGVAFTDLDLDGYVDLVAANGHIEPDINEIQRDVEFAQIPQLFRNDGSGRFREATGDAGEPFAEPIVARAVATADIDRDGDIDILMTVNGGAPRLLRNDLADDDATWIRLTLRGRAPNLDAVGALVTAYAGDLVQRKTVVTGVSYLSQSEMGALLFGLGGAAQADSVTVRWPTTAAVTKVGPVLAGAEVTITER